MMERVLIMRNLTLIVLVLLCAALPARGQDHPLKFAVANPFQIYAQIKETKDYAEQVKADNLKLQQEQNQKVKEINDKVQDRDNSYKPGHPLYTKKTEEIDELSAKLAVWQEMIKRRQPRDDKRHLVEAYRKIEAAVAKVAEQGKIDIVLSSGPRELPQSVDQMSMDEVDRLITSRKVMYANKGIPDITEQVIAALDADYAKNKGTAQ